MDNKGLRSPLLMVTIMDKFPKYSVYYFSGTHWDREWYQTFQGFRLMLVRMLDGLLDHMESHPEFGVFHLDGQTIVLEDYMEVRPENRARLEALIRTGRLVIGPWYCMPDEFLVSGEALIRNLTLGMSLSRQWGSEPWKVGYLCDIFGHIAQMPQILRGMGISCAVLGRGTNQHNTPPFFQWVSPDGSRVLTYKLPDKSGYGAFSMDVVGQRVREETTPPDSGEFRQKAAAYMEGEKERANIPVLVVLDAMDHEPLHEETAAYLDELRRMYPDDTFYHTNLLQAFEEAEQFEDELPQRAGELNQTARAKGLHLHLLTNILSSRYNIKRRNDRAESLLENWIEPMMLLFSKCGLSYPAAYRQIAWKSLLQNHPHDSICGCAVDRVHQEMDYRFSQVESLYEAILEDAEYRLAGGRHLLTGSGREFISLLCPLPYETDGCVDITLPFARDYPKWSEPFGYEEICAFRLYDGGGEEIPYAIREIRTDAAVRTVGEKVVRADLYRLVLCVKRPALGILSLRVVPSDCPVRFMGDMTADHVLENRHIRLTVQPDGRLTLLDKKTGREYADLLGLCDDGEIGDGWNSVRPAVDRRVTGDRVESVSVRVAGPVYSELEVRRVMQVPACMAGSTRGETETALRCTFSIGLGCDDRYADIRLSVENTARDHRLRLLLPTGIDADTYEAGQAFAFVRREVGADLSTHDWKEKSVIEKAMDGILALRDAQGTGLAFLSDFGLHEGGIERDDKRTAYITLLRCFSKTYTTNGEPGGQQLGRSDYRFRLRPLDDAVSSGALMREQADMRAGVRAFVTREARTDACLHVEGDACVSACKPAEDGSGDEIIRLFNPGERAVNVLVKADRPGDWQLCDLLEQVQTMAASSRAELPLTLEAGKIQTLRFSSP